MTLRTTIKTGLTALVLVVSLGGMTGCSTISEIRDAIPNIDVDEDGGSVTIEGDDGESMTIDTSAGGEIPEWFPSELPLPENYIVANAVELEGSDGMLKGMNLTTPDALDDFVASIDEALADLGITPSTREVGDLGGMSSAMFGIPVEGELWTINAVDYGEGELIVGYTLSTE